MWALFQERQGEGDRSGEVLELLRRAADAGLAAADYQLGTWMLEGKAGAVNPREARERILRAAYAGLPAKGLGRTMGRLKSMFQGKG
jgi:hypothetical protein